MLFTELAFSGIMLEHAIPCMAQAAVQVLVPVTAIGIIPKLLLLAKSPILKLLILNVPALSVISIPIVDDEKKRSSVNTKTPPVLLYSIN